MAILPLDVVDAIVDTLARSEDDPSLPATKACSLACYEYSVICRKRIFAHIVVNQRTSQYTPPPKFGWQHRSTTTTLHELLHKSPEIINHIRSLDYNRPADFLLTDDISQDLELFAETLVKLTRLESFGLRCFGFEWNDTPSLRPGLLHILQLPTLIDLYVEGVKGFCLGELALPRNLQEFGFDGLELTSDCPQGLRDAQIKLRRLDLGPYSSPAIVQMCDHICTNGQRFIDLTTVEELTIRWFYSSDAAASYYLLSHCESLTSLRYFNSDTPDPSGMSFDSLSEMLALSTATKTLKYLEIDTIYKRDMSEDIYHGFAKALLKLANNNVIEEIKIAIFIQMMSDCDRGDEWGTLDTALASGFRNLRLCSVTVGFIQDSPVVSGLEEALMNVRETQFPKLSSNRDVLFEFVLQKENRSYSVS
ncbi:hypothetical protein BDN70DRAFT_918721 [Pholiota conissans]|uniref:Uncharacterized protein n=1 Tax=Pholiota conissans TaxID=109636 RepID=A0A9P6D4Z0_9AGAR|nr:hypothetical protein BDN70DRAFT_918721 [Pholiota conissans]